MYDYISLRIDAKPCNEIITDLLADALAEIDYETFQPDDSGLMAYIRKDLFSINKVEEALKDFPMKADFKFSWETIVGEDWNKEWEQNYFKPINIEDKVVVRSSFHNDAPQLPIEILIDPKMAFGTGHHSTTAGMVSLILDLDLKGKSVIDMGTGTGILAILCKKLGASEVTAIEIDPFALENAEENGLLNNVKIDWRVGDVKSLVELKPADCFLANINLNVILADLSKYVEKLKTGGKMLLSGFYEKDLPQIEKSAIQYELKTLKIKIDKDWVAMLLEKL
ncbi:MAG: 50S ribosomal protein L11 methyltransferase [Muribaculaceae bacterium]|nr:50S ribosomal protein L11 methyltransferase [Muribaculaceae bacterium]